MPLRVLQMHARIRRQNVVNLISGYLMVCRVSQPMCRQKCRAAVHRSDAALRKLAPVWRAKVITDFTQDYQVESAEILLFRKSTASYANVGESFTTLASLFCSGRREL